MSLVHCLQGDPTYLIVKADNTIEKFGVNAVCTHLGCVVPWVAVSLLSVLRETQRALSSRSPYILSCLPLCRLRTSSSAHATALSTTLRARSCVAPPLW